MVMLRTARIVPAWCLLTAAAGVAAALMLFPNECASLVQRLRGGLPGFGSATNDKLPPPPSLDDGTGMAERTSPRRTAPRSAPETPRAPAEINPFALPEEPAVDSEEVIELLDYQKGKGARRSPSRAAASEAKDVGTVVPALETVEPTRGVRSAQETDFGPAPTREPSDSVAKPRQITPIEEILERLESDAETDGAPPVDFGDSAAVVRAAQNLIDAGEHQAAHRLLSRWYWRQRAAGTAPAPGAARPGPAIELLMESAERCFRSPQPHLEEPYVIAPGDQLRKVAARYGVSWQFLSKLNKVDAKRIRAGQRLKVLRGPFSALIDCSEFTLTVHLRGLVVNSYLVGIGKDGTTPLGTFQVRDKLENPTYYGPEGVVGADDPANPLGERWIDIGDSFGIHGTIEPKSIGRKESRGCIRMRNPDVEDVYDLLTVGSEVVIQP